IASATATLLWLHRRSCGVRAMVTNRKQGTAKLITKVIRLFTFLLSTTFRRPAMYPSSSPAKIGTSALARIVIISIGLVFRPLGFGHSVGRRVTSGQHHKSGSKHCHAKGTEASPAEMLPGERSDGCSGCSPREETCQEDLVRGFGACG